MRRRTLGRTVVLAPLLRVLPFPATCVAMTSQLMTVVCGNKEQPTLSVANS